MVSNIEKYQGIRALFNADLHTVCPEWAPREDWMTSPDAWLRRIVNIDGQPVVPRPPTVDEMPAVRRLRFEEIDAPLGIESEDRLSENDSHPDVIHMASFIRKQLVSTVRLDPHDHETYMVRRMATHPDYRGQGVGTITLLWAEAAAYERGIRNFKLYARPEAVAFYAGAGLDYTTTTGEIETHDGQENITMEKQVI